MLERPRAAFLILGLLFLLPQSLYVIGDYLAVGIRFPIFRYQYSSMGTSVIPLNREIGYVTSGIIRWSTPAGTLSPSAIAPWIWLAGVLLLCAAAALLISWHFLGNPGHARFVGPLLLTIGGLFLLWAVVQFGPFFSGPSGYSIPVGVPLLWYCGYQFMQAAKGAGDQDPGEKPDLPEDP